MDISPSLIQFLEKSPVGASWEIFPLSGDSGERTYSRIQTSDKSYVLVLYPKDKRGFESFIEVQSLMKKQNLNVPYIYATDSKHGYQLIEDIGSLSLEEFYSENRDLRYYRQTLHLINQIQKIDNPPSRRLGEEKFIQEMQLTYGGLEIVLDSKTFHQMLQEWKALYQEIQSSPFQVAHCDMHSRNLLIYNKLLYTIDFQDMGLYPEYYDLVSLLEDSYIVLTEKEKKTLLEDYEEISSKPVNMKLYQSVYCQRGFKAVGCFLKFYRERKQTSHLQYVLPTLKKVEHCLNQLGNYPRFTSYIQQVLKEK